MKQFAKQKWWLIFLLIPAIIVTICCTVFVPFEVTLPGGLSEVKSGISIDGSKVKKEKIHSIYIISMEKMTIFQRLILRHNREVEIYPADKRFDHLSLQQKYQIGMIQKNQSIEASLIVSYQTASKEDETIQLAYQYEGRIVTYTLQEETIFQPGDFIQEINGFAATQDRILFEEAFFGLKNGDRVLLKRGSKDINVTYQGSSQRTFASEVKYRLEKDSASPKFSIYHTTTVGPSAGLLQTISIYNQLVEEDITKGKNISGTGTMDAFGNVGRIGGIQQKIYTAYRNQVEVFFCPKGDYEEALVAYNSLKNKNRMKLIPVSTFEEALHELQSL